MTNDIIIFLDGRKLTKEQKEYLIEDITHNSRRNDIRRQLILKGYVPELALSYIRNILGLKQSKKLNELRNREIKDANYKMGFKMDYNYSLFKLIDNENGINLEIKNISLTAIRGIINVYYQVVVANQYNVSFENVNDKTIIDAGANVGIFALLCAKLGAKKVYAFEPVTETYNIMEEQIRLNKLQDKIIPIKMALGNEDGTLKINYKEAGDTDASIWRESIGKQEEVKIVKIDSFIKDIVGFIKIDVEGFEENVLRGATKTIQKYKPILCFSAYHKPTDKDRLPIVVNEIRDDYEIDLLKRAEEDFYCK